ncbi:MAG: UDP-2,3-diacylglucosamine diphosphatase [Pseudobdellovibrionaceae bacterium]
MRAWFISDIHLRNINERNSVILLRFLRFLQQDSQTTHLFLLGDIFDLWVGDSDVFQRKFQALVDAIAELKRKGVEVVYFEGNHDVHVKGFWENKLGVPVLVDYKIFELGPHRVRMEHGDFINPDDQLYLKYRAFVRQPKLEKLAYILPGKLLDDVGSWSSRKSRKKSSVMRRDSEDDLRQKIRRFAASKAQETAFDYIITGHMHVRDEYEFEVKGEKRISINLGSWFEKPRALCLTERGYEWKELD